MTMVVVAGEATPGTGIVPCVGAGAVVVAGLGCELDDAE